MTSGLRIESGSCVIEVFVMFGGLVLESSTAGIEECRPSGVGVADEILTRSICSVSESCPPECPIADELRECVR